MKKLILSFVAVALAATAFAEKKPEMMSWDDAYTKATDVLKTLSLDEKIEMTRGHNRFFLSIQAWRYRLCRISWK